MARGSNTVIMILNVIFLVVAVVAIGFSLYFQVGAANLCNKILQKPFLYIGLALFVVSFLGFIGSVRLPPFLWIYLALLFFFIVATMGFTIFTIMVTNKGVGNALSNKGFPDARLGDYSNWLQRYVVNGENWESIKSCLVKAELCSRVVAGQDIDFYKTTLTLTQSGCCKPPIYCELEFLNLTTWVMPAKGPAVPDSDCLTWSNVQTELCFECKSCKASVLDNIKNEWSTLFLINVIILATIITVYSVGCCALRNNRGKR